jgi:hypothetical protein
MRRSAPPAQAPETGMSIRPAQPQALALVWRAHRSDLVLPEIRFAAAAVFDAG